MFLLFYLCDIFSNVDNIFIYEETAIIQIKRSSVSSALERLKSLTAKISSYELARKENMKILQTLFERLELSVKVGTFENIFNFKAINLSGVSLVNETLGEIKEGKYVQIIAIAYDKNAKVKNKNISLGYYGRTEKIDIALKEDIIAFILRWRFEKSFMTLEHYYEMLGSLSNSSDV